MGRKPTAHDVAVAAGVSASTVDRVLNNRGGVARAKEHQVLVWARKLGLDRALDHRAARTLRVAIVLQEPDNPFHAAMQTHFHAANQTCAPLNLQFTVFHAGLRNNAQIAQMIDDLGARYDGLIVTLPRHQAITEALARARARIPLITLATDIPECGRHAYVGPDDWRAGRVAGDLMGRFLVPAGGNVLIIAGMMNMEGQQHRVSGFRAVLQQRYRACQAGRVLECQEDGHIAGKLAARALVADPDLRGIYIASLGAGAVADAVLSSKRSDRVAIVTHELTEDRRELLRNGLIDAVIDQDSRHEVAVAVDTMARLLGRLDGPPVSTITPVHIHMIENVG